MSTLMLHCGARTVNLLELDEASQRTPAPTATWFPIAHNVVLNTARQALTHAGFGIRKLQVGLARDDGRMFATIDTESALGFQASVSVAVVNSVDRSLPMKFIAGTRVSKALAKSGYMLETPMDPTSARTWVGTISRKDRLRTESSETTRLTPCQTLLATISSSKVKI